MEIGSYNEMVELVDKIQIAHRYNEACVTFNQERIPVETAQWMVNMYLKGDGNGGSS